MGTMRAMRHPRVTLREILVAGARDLPSAPRRLAALPTLFRADTGSRFSMGAMVEAVARRHADRPAVHFGDESITWRQFNRLANRLAFRLRLRGVRPGQRVAMLAGNSPLLLACIAALAKLGAVAAPLNTALRGRSLVHALSAVGPDHLLVDEDGARVAAALGERAGPDAWTLAELDLDAASDPTWDPDSTGRVCLGDPALLVGTSGTTGPSKASVMSHLRWVKASAAYGSALLALEPRDVVYVPLPLFHNLALTACWAACCRTGAALALAPRFSAGAFWDDCRRHGATVVAYIGEIPRYLLSQPERQDDREHRVTRAVGVGMRPELWRPFMARFGVERVCETYGASEGNTLFVNPFAIPGTVGFTITPHALVAWDAETGDIARDDGGRPLLARSGEPGLLLSRVTPRFSYDGYTDAEASEARLRRDLFRPGDVWFDSGDLLRKVGWQHAAFVDRVGETYRWKSENVSTAEVESVLGTDPQVADCAVYGVEIPGLPGRAGMAAIVLRSPEIGLDGLALVRGLRDELPTFAIPVFARLKSELETTSTCKHRKVDLQREGYAPSLVADPLFVLPAGADRYVPLTMDLWGRIERGEMRL